MQSRSNRFFTLLGLNSISSLLKKKPNPTGVTINCLHPGAVRTEIFRNAPAWFQAIAVYPLSPFFKVAVPSNLT